jgi:hypothetical protein
MIDIAREQKPKHAVESLKRKRSEPGATDAREQSEKRTVGKG